MKYVSGVETPYSAISHQFHILSQNTSIKTQNIFVIFEKISKIKGIFIAYVMVWCLSSLTTFKEKLWRHLDNHSPIACCDRPIEAISLSLCFVFMLIKKMKLVRNSCVRNFHSWDVFQTIFRNKLVFVYFLLNYLICEFSIKRT